MSITLYYAPDNASLAPHICLRKIGMHFDLALVDKTRGDQRSEWYTALNPHARIPTLVHGDPADGGVIVREAAAICLYLAEHFPESGLMPSVGNLKRPAALDMLVYLTNTVQADLMVWNYCARYVDTPEEMATIKRKTGVRLDEMFALLDRHLDKDGPFVSGEHVSCVDYFLLMLAGWGEQFGIVDLPSTRPALLHHARLCQSLPEVQAAFSAEGVDFFF